MLYSILIYDSEPIVSSWTKQKDNDVVAEHVALQQELAASGKLGPVVRLNQTKDAVTVRADAMVTDGPYTETKEALLGLYVVDCAAIEEAVKIAKRIPNQSGSTYCEVRPVCWYEPGGNIKELK